MNLVTYFFIGLITSIIGVYLGKLLTLYAYGKFSYMLKMKMKNITTIINRVIGILLIFISIFQVTKILYS